jgi:hypothetical protein
MEVQIHKGNSSIWNTPWCDIWDTIHSHLNLPITVMPLPLTINQLWNHLSQTWNIDLINQIFSPQAAQTISQTEIIPSTEKDVFVWKPAPNVVCTAKQAFSFLNAESQVQLPGQGPRSVSPQAMQIMQRVWRNKTCSPNLKTFTWRLIRRALATGRRAGAYSSNIYQVCSDCNYLENDAHLFFLCKLPRAVWFTANPSINTTSLPQEDDGVQAILTTIITPHTTDDEMVKILYIIWYIWKAKNDKRFNNKNWTVWQIHHAAKADCQVTRSVLQDGIHSSITEQTSHLTHQNEVHLPGCTNMQEHRRTNIEEDHIPFRTYQHFCRDMPQLPLYRICPPAMLQGLNIYTNASIPQIKLLWLITMQDLEYSYKVQDHFIILMYISKLIWPLFPLSSQRKQQLLL